jgi:hypothetical protein
MKDRGLTNPGMSDSLRVAEKSRDLGLSDRLRDLGLELFPAHTFQLSVRSRSKHEWRE